MKHIEPDSQDKTEAYRKGKKRRQPDRGIEKKRRQRRFERNQRAASKERHSSKTKGKGLAVLGKDDRFLRPKDLRKLKDAPDEIQFRDN
jgi:hypothetical protein